MFFNQLVVQEKSGGDHNGATPDYRAFLYYSYEREGSIFEIRGYGANPAKAAADAWQRYIDEEKEDD